MIAHIEYLVELVGVDHVGVATDAYMDGWPPDSGHYADADLAALDRWVRLAARLHAKGWTDGDLKKLLGGNFRRLFAEVLAKKIGAQVEHSFDAFHSLGTPCPKEL